MAIPVSLEDAKRQLRQGGEDLDDERRVEVEGFIADAAAWVERYTGHVLVARNVTQQVRVPGRVIELSAWPIAHDAVADVVDGALMPVLGARLDLSSRPARIVQASSACWPLRHPDQTLIITVRAGYEPDDLVPGNFRRAMLILIGAFDRDREGGKVLTDAEAVARRLCGDFRLRRV